MNKKIILTIVGLSTILLSACKSTNSDRYTKSSVDGLSHFYVDEMDVVNYTVKSELSAIKASEYYITDEKLKAMNGDIGLFNWEQFLPYNTSSIPHRSISRGSFKVSRFDQLYNDVIFSNFSRFCALKKGNIVSEEIVYLPNVNKGATYHICQVNNKYSSAVVIKHSANHDGHTYYIDSQASSEFKASLKELSPKTSGGWLLLLDGNLIRYKNTVEPLTYNSLAVDDDIPIPLLQSIFFESFDVRVYFKDTAGKEGKLEAISNFYFGRERVYQSHVGGLSGVSDQWRTIQFEMEDGEVVGFSSLPDKKNNKNHPSYLHYKGEKIRAIIPDGYDSQLSKEQVTALIDKQIQYDYSKIDSEDDWKLLTTIYKNWDLSRLNETVRSQIQARLKNEPIEQNNIAKSPKAYKADNYRVHSPSKNAHEKETTKVKVTWENVIPVTYRANKAYEEGRYKDAIKLYEALANYGLESTALTLGDIYFTGKGEVKSNYREAKKWYQMAAKQGDSVAKLRLAVMYFEGYGVEKDLKKSRKLMRAAALEGVALAQSNLGQFYFFGWGGYVDKAEAVTWFKKAAVQNDPKGLGLLGAAYAEGIAVQKSIYKAKQYLVKSCNLNYQEACSNLKKL